jgi:hypothetical protein
LPAPCGGILGIFILRVQIAGVLRFMRENSSSEGAIPKHRLLILGEKHYLYIGTDKRAGSRMS